MGSALRIPLKGASALYGIVTRIRNLLYDRRVLPSYRSTLPIVSIGNITAGGNGKTPLCIYLVRELLARNFRPVVLTRGYKGNIRGPHLVHRGNTPTEVGDEPYLMTRKFSAPIVIARDRAEGARFIEQSRLGDVIVLDDGFQHRKLARDVDIVCIFTGCPEARERFLEGELLPSGLFREERDSALARADIVVLAERRPREPNENEIPSKILNRIPEHVRIYQSFLETQGFVDIGEYLASSGGSGEFEAQRRTKIESGVALCAIANPEAFFLTIESLGVKLLGRYAFPDHQAVSRSDVERIRREFPGVALLCTEKDAVKFAAVGLLDLFVLIAKTEVEPADAFVVQIVRQLMGFRTSPENASLLACRLHSNFS